MEVAMSRTLPTLLLALSLFPAAAFAGEIKVHILDATVKDKVIAGAEIILQKNGETSLTAKTDAHGDVVFANPFKGVDDDSVSLIAKKAGYSNLVVRCPCNKLTYALSPIIRSLDGMRIVLHWGAKPNDLDSHLVYESQHVYFSKRRGKDANLDVDDIDGFGPETITIERKHPGVRYVYAVHNYSEGDSKGSRSLSNTADAKVFVYIGSSLVRTFRPPTGQKGNVWIVFAVGEDGEFYDINQFTDITSRNDVDRPLAQIIKGGPLVSSPATLSAGGMDANTLNREGERAYHAKDLEEAVRLYNEAINLNPEHSQAYSNLGLAYQRLGRQAEAIWANRKAIALASGRTAKTVKASSYYNIARVYEEQGEWQRALDAYKAALGFKRNDAYQKGIERMQAKLGQ
jgi:uncharacterized protein YfaP (DUF2135 family)